MKLTHPTNLANFSCLITNENEMVYFSYETPIALVRPDCTTIISNNEWRQTTGKHINYVKAHTHDHMQVPHDELMHLLSTY